MTKKMRTLVGSKKKTISSNELDKRFDDGESVLPYSALEQGTFRVNVDFPTWTVKELDREATRLGITRQSLIKIWITERIDQKRPEGKKRAVG